MERYKAYWGKGHQDFCVIYADTEEAVRRIFQKYHPGERLFKIELWLENPTLRDFYKEIGCDDEHEYLLAIIEAAEDVGVEDKIVEYLKNRGWGR